MLLVILIAMYPILAAAALLLLIPLFIYVSDNLLV